jgi:hypothetical protein
MDKLLMSKENPNGHKLEELLAQLQDELQEKSERLIDDTCPVSRVLRRNNGYIESLLGVAERIQRESMSHLDTLGEDTGPTGASRI